jgi:hypothetical protein
MRAFLVTANRSVRPAEEIYRSESCAIRKLRHAKVVTLFVIIKKDQLIKDQLIKVKSF